MKKILTWLRTKIDRVIAREFLCVTIIDQVTGKELFRGTHLDCMLYIRLSQQLQFDGDLVVKMSITTDAYV